MTTGVCRLEGHDHARCSDGEGQTWENPSRDCAGCHRRDQQIGRQVDALARLRGEPSPVGGAS